MEDGLGLGCPRNKLQGAAALETPAFRGSASFGRTRLPWESPGAMPHQEQGVTLNNHTPHMQCDSPAASTDTSTSKKKCDQEEGVVSLECRGSGVVGKLPHKEELRLG